MWPGFHAARTPDKAAIIMAGSGEVVTYAELDAASNRLAQLLYARGLRWGDHIALCMENCAALPRGDVGGAALGAGVHADQLPPHRRGDGVHRRRLRRAGADRQRRARATRRRRWPRSSARTVHDPARRSAARCPATSATRTPSPASRRRALAEELEGAPMLYSSGTTGRPKGVAQPHPRMPMGTPLPIVEGFCRLYAVGADTVYLSPAPLYHAAPLHFSMSILRAGGTVVVMERFDPEEALALIERYQVTHSQWVPTMFVRLLKLAGGRAPAPRSLVAPHRHPRRRAVPGGGEGADDRLVGADPVRVLLVHRGHRRDHHRQRRMAGAQGLGRPRARRHHAHPRRRRPRAAARRGGPRLLRAGHRRCRSRYHKDPDKTARAAQRARLGDRSATSATSTPRATSTSPTARTS